MTSRSNIGSALSASRRLIRLLACVGALSCLLAVLVSGAASAAVVTVGSPLSVPATLNTAENLGYQGTDTNVLPTAEIPTGVVHTYHYGADNALWSSEAAMPATGQALSVKLEGCAKPAAGGPPPLTQVHFQSISPLPGGGAKVNLSSQPFDVPVCGQNEASSTTVTTYKPINLCVSAGDYVDLNDEGGFVEHFYQSGVPYQVLGAVRGSSFNSFIRGDGTNNGDVMAASDTSTMDGFAASRNEELMLQVELGTGADATHICPGGTAGLPPVLPPIRVSPQTDGINSHRIVSIAVYCRPAQGCAGVATLTFAGKVASVGQSGFSLAGNKTGHLPMRVSPRVVSLIRKHHGLRMTLTATVGSKTITQTVLVKIF
jgi:hypothetical protein